MRDLTNDKYGNRRDEMMALTIKGAMDEEGHIGLERAKELIRPYFADEINMLFERALFEKAQAIIRSLREGAMSLAELEAARLAERTRAEKLIDKTAREPISVDGPDKSDQRGAKS